METFRLSSKLHDNNREYLIQTSNDVSMGSVATTVYVDGVRTESFVSRHDDEIEQDQLLELVKKTHGERKQELEGLLETYQLVVELGDPDQMFKLATALYHKRLLHEASDLLRSIINLSPEHHPAYFRLGVTYLALGKTEAALEVAAKAVNFRPEYADYRNQLGEAYLAAGMTDEAIVELEAAIGINLYYGEAYLNLGLAHTFGASRCQDRDRADQHVAQAKECFHKTTHIYPECLHLDDFVGGMKALEDRDFGRAISSLKAVRESRKELRRKDFIALNRRLLSHADAWTEEAIGAQIKSLESRLKEHATYLDLQTELVRCYLDRSSLIWVKGIEQCRKILNAVPEAKIIPEVLDAAEEVRQHMAEAIERIVQKG